MRRYLWFMMLLMGVVLIAGVGCSPKDKGGPKELLDKFFTSAIQQDYATSYTCYYDAYKAKVSKEEFIKHRKEASVLQAYKIVSLTQNKDTAQAEVLLTFAPSEKLSRKEAATTTVKEEMVKQNDGWKIKVWE
ncbi:MAG: hypothetical protein LUO89_11000 [Methanothrix sp.]|nr:hypothetical protein [Methanothrix sp.]